MARDFKASHRIWTAYRAGYFARDEQFERDLIIDLKGPTYLDLDAPSG